MNQIEILPSLLAADFSRLGEEIASVEKAGVNMLHVDVMDGHFVPNLTMGTAVVQSLRKFTRLALDVHLMITDPDKFAPMFIDAGANLVSVHQEVCPNLDRTLNMIRKSGVRAGVVINPSTPVNTLTEVLDIVDFVLVMSVNPGFGGQAFIPNSINKVRQLDRFRSDRGLQYAIEIDGGIGPQNIADVARAGCDWFVAGSSVFHSVNPGHAVEDLRRSARATAAV